MRIHRLILAQNVPALAHKTRAVGDEAVAAAARARVDGAGDREHVASLLERRIGGDERARTLERRFDHHGRKTQAADDADGKMPALRRRSRRVFGQQRARGGNVAVKARVLLGIHHVQTVAEHGDGHAARAECAAVGRRVDAPRRTGDNERPLLGQAVGNLLRALRAVGRTRAGADHRDGDLFIERGQRALDVQKAGRLEDAAQPRGIVRVLHRQDAQAETLAVAENFVRAVRRFVGEQLDLLFG